MARVTGIGGVFFRSPDPKRLADWYAQHLGLQLDEAKMVTFVPGELIPPDTEVTIWSSFPEDTDYFGERPVQQQYMLNYRVDDLDALLAQLAAAEVWIDPKRDDSPFGRFAWIRDCDGNRLELWQPL